MIMSGPVRFYPRPFLYLRKGIHLVYGKGGRSTILKTDVSWRTISGVVVNTKWGTLWLYFRNWR